MGLRDVGHWASEHVVSTEPCQRSIFLGEAQGYLALLPKPTFRRGLSCFWKPVLSGATVRRQ